MRSYKKIYRYWEWGVLQEDIAIDIENEECYKKIYRYWEVNVFSAVMLFIISRWNIDRFSVLSWLLTVTSWCVLKHTLLSSAWYRTWRNISLNFLQQLYILIYKVCHGNSINMRLKYAIKILMSCSGGALELNFD